MSMLHAESCEDCGDIAFLSETDPSTIRVNLYAEELAYWTEVCYLVFLSEFRFDFDRSFGGSLCISHGDIVNIQKYHNVVTAKIVVRIGKGLSVPKRE